VEVRDWIDVIESSDRVQHLGYLAWAACGKDPGYNPAMILGEARRSGHYSAAEVAQLAFDGPVPDAAALSVRWRRMVHEADAIVEALPPGEVARVVLGRDGELFTGSADDLVAALTAGDIAFHEGAIRGALPRVLGS
jgi:hypothetical protein